MTDNDSTEASPATADSAMARRLKVLASLSCALFEGLDVDMLMQIAGRARFRRFTKGQVLTAVGAPAAVQVMLTGTAKWSMVRQHRNNDLLLEVLRPGDVFGEAEIFGASAGHCQAVALTDGEALVLPAADLPPLLARHPEIGVRWLEQSFRSLHRTRQLVADAVFLDIGGRLYRRLLDLCRVSDGSIATGDRLEHGLSQRELASCIGASRESLNKLLASWQRDGMVTVGRGFLIVHKPVALKAAAACEDAEPAQETTATVRPAAEVRARAASPAR